MKTNRLIAAIVVALAFCVVSTKATVGSGPPNKLPMMGSVTAFRSWIVTNQMLSVSVSVRYTNNAGILVGPGNLKGIKFVSEDSYQSYIRSNGFRIFSENAASFDPSRPLYFVVDIGYGLPDLDPSGVVLVTRVRKPIGLPSTVTSNSFVGSVPFNEHAYVSVPGLQRFTVEVGGEYTYTWAPTAGKVTTNVNVISPPAPELTTNNYVVLNPWYSMGTNQTEVRISVTADGRTMSYSQFGESLNTPPTISLSRGNLSCTFTRGALVSLETSTNLWHWSVMTNWSDLGGIGFSSFSITENQPQQFFKVGIR